LRDDLTVSTVLESDVSREGLNRMVSLAIFDHISTFPVPGKGS
jgi:hypothetical protein